MDELEAVRTEYGLRKSVAVQHKLCER